ncbi:ABC transporter permease [Virgibacillus soli]
MQWLILLQKEMVENWRNFKWIWVPLVFILLAIMDPISTYYLPQILEAVGGLPEGAVFEIPDPLPREVIMMSLNQLGSLGILIIVLIAMSSITNERKSGVAEIILVKPVSYANYITAKWFVIIILVWLSLVLSLGMSGYYINLLFGNLGIGEIIKVISFYGLWLTLIATIAIFYNTLFKTAGLVAFMSIFTVIGLSIITSVFGKHLTWSPANLTSHIHEMLVMHEVTTDLVVTSLITIILIAGLLFSSIYIFKTKEIGD